MSISDIDWSVVVLRGVTVLAIWLLVWAARCYLVRWIKGLGRTLESIKLEEQDIHVLESLANIILFIVGLGATLSVLKLTSLLLAGTVIWRIIALALVWVVVWILVRYLSRWIELFDQQTDGIEIDPRDMRTLDRLLDYLVILIGAIISLAILNLTSLLYSILTAAGIISVMIGSAVKDIAANFISGIFLLIDRPFVVGDSIKIQDFSGTVNKISLRSTEITTYDGPIVTIPNSIMALEPTINYTLSRDRRVLFTVSVLNTADLNLVIQTIQEVLDAEKRLLPDKLPSITVGAIRDSAIDFQVIAYTDKDEIITTQSDLQKEVVASFTRQGIELAVPLRMNLSSARAVQPNLPVPDSEG